MIMKQVDTAAYLAAIIESSGDAIVSNDLDGRITSWNKAAENLFGYSADEAIGKHISIVIPEGKIDEEYVISGKIRDGEKIDNFETIRRTKNGDLRHVSLSISPIQDIDGKIIGASKIARDTTMLKEAERASAHLAAIIDSSDDAILSKSLEGYILSWNGAAEKLFGYTAEESVGKHITMLIPAELMDEEYTILGKVKEGQKVDHFETIRCHKDGTRLNISLTVSPIRNRGGEIIGASKIARNITEQRRTESALIESNRRKDEFLANMSHEMRTPMNAIIGLSNLLERSDTLTEKQQSFVRTLKQSAESLMSLINNLLDFSKIETGAIVLEKAEFDLCEIIASVTDLVQLKAQEKNLPLNIVYEGYVNRYYVGDALRLRHVLTNLVDNAIKFTDRGSVGLKVQAQEVQGGDGHLRFIVTDTGIGISEDKLETIFEKFTQADSSTSRKYGGTGLGLAITKALTEQMGGSIHVKSRIGLGSTFIVDISFLKSERQATITSNAHTPKSTKIKDILIVEDYEPNAMVIAGFLDLLGYEYDAVPNGLEAIRMVTDTNYSVVLMDVQMPGMDGIECARRMRAIENEEHAWKTTIIAMTAHIQDAQRDKCMKAGMDDFIPKPFDPVILEKTLKRYIQERAEA